MRALAAGPIFGLCVLLGLSVVSSGALGAPPTAEQQRVACTPDAFRLCSHEIPSLTRIIQCLRDNRPNLSLECGRIFDAMEPRGRPATRSLSKTSTTERFWCAGKRPGEPPPDVWAAWCEEAALTR